MGRFKPSVKHSPCILASCSRAANYFGVTQMPDENLLKIILYRLLFLFVLILVFFVTLGHCQSVSPFMGLGNIQWFDNNGVPLTGGVLYSYQAGTSTQQATYTDSTATTLNPNPIPFTSGARVGIWTTTAQTYKFVLCLQNDGPTCAPGDVLFSVDQVPGGPSGGGGGGGGGTGTFTGVFISGTANPATSGILRLASGDTVCWRNVANSANLCLLTDTADVLTWQNSAAKFTEGTCANTGAGFDYLCASSSNHRWMMSNNGGSATQIVGAGVDINNSDQVTQLHFGSTAAPLSTIAPTITNQYLTWSGSNVLWAGPVEGTITSSVLSGTTGPCASGGCSFYTFGANHALTRLIVNTVFAPSGCSPNAVVGVRDITSSTNLLTQTPTALGVVTTTGSVTITAGHNIGIGVISLASGCTQVANFVITAVYQ